MAENYLNCFLNVTLHEGIISPTSGNYYLCLIVEYMAIRRLKSPADVLVFHNILF